MCGICGTIGFEADTSAREASIVQRMSQLLRHRGPDDQGFYDGKYAKLASRRLSIIDLEGGHQPMTNERRTLWLVFNGEIFNYTALRRELEERSHRFRSNCDTEVILHAFEEWGTDCLHRLNGMFALALWDKRQRHLLLARDRLGIKPLYYWKGKKRLVFASELKALVAHPEVPREIDPVALDHFLSLEYIPSPRTIFKNIYKLEPGQRLVLKQGIPTLEKYWDLGLQDVPDDESECRSTLMDLLDSSIRLSLTSDVPLGVLLSGGIDSGAVTCLASRWSNEPLKSFSLGFEEDSYNELPWARQVAARFGTDHQEELLTSTRTAELAVQLLRNLDEPLADFSVFPTYLISLLARNQVKAVLSGDGGDEIFGGYETYTAQKLDRYYRRLPEGIRRQLLPAVMQSIPPSPGKKGLINKAKRFVEGAAMPPDLQHTRWMIFLDQKQKSLLYSPWFQSELDGDPTVHLLTELFHRAPGDDALARQQYVDIKTYLADNILAKVDRMSMSVSLEVRVPLLDYRLVEFAFNLPPKWKMNHGKGKVLLRKVMADRLPEGVLNKPKQGFSIPLKNWLGGPLRPLMTDLLSADSISKSGFFNPSTVDLLIEQHLAGHSNHSHRIWALMVFQMWLSTVEPVLS